MVPKRGHWFTAVVSKFTLSLLKIKIILNNKSTAIKHKKNEIKDGNRIGARRAHCIWPRFQLR